MTASNPSLSEVLGEAYGTKTASAEDLEKQAQVELFTNLCQQAGVDLSKMTDPQVEELWKTAMIPGAAPFPPVAPAAAQAAPPPPPSKKDEGEKKEEKEEKEEKKDEEKKEAAARKEYIEKRAMAEKLAEADAIGRVMAHAYVDEFRKLAAAMKVAEDGAPPPFPPKEEKKEEKKPEEEKKEGSILDRLRKVAGVSAAPTTPKVASSTAQLDEFAGNFAIDMLKQAGVDEQLAISRINAVHTLGVGESTKVAAAGNFDQAVYFRALEYCEAAGFPVDWNKA